MRLFIIILLACVWIGLAIESYSKGQTAMAGVFVLVGSALTIVRLNR